VRKRNRNLFEDTTSGTGSSALAKRSTTQTQGVSLG